MAIFVDTHAHLTASNFDSDRDEVIARALDNGVGYIVNPATNLDDSRQAIELAEKHPCVYACVGFHPHDAQKADDRSMAEIEELSKSPKVVAIGEIGLDFHYDFSPRSRQREVFVAQIEIAQRRDLPIVIHTRESINETIAIVEEFAHKFPHWRARGSGRTAVRGVFHCFSGDREKAAKVIGLGFYVSFPGIVTFKNAKGTHEVVANGSLDDFLLETDSPYLSPVPLRGQRNEPANIPLIAKKIAELQHEAIENVARITTANAYNLFGIGEPERGAA